MNTYIHTYNDYKSAWQTQKKARGLRRKDGLESGVRRVVAHVRVELHQELEGHWRPLGHLHHMLCDHRRRGVHYA